MVQHYNYRINGRIHHVKSVGEASSLFLQICARLGKIVEFRFVGTTYENYSKLS